MKSFWLGRRPLWQAFWLLFVLGNMCILWISLRLRLTPWLYTFILGLLIDLLFLVFSSVSAWRCSKNTKWKGWLWLARLVIISWFLFKTASISAEIIIICSHGIAALSFIPLIGILFALIAIIWGLTTKKLRTKKLALIGTGGIAFTIILCFGLNYYYSGFVKPHLFLTEYEWRYGQAQGGLILLVDAIELYKAQYGAYPESLEVAIKLRMKKVPMIVVDPTDVLKDGQLRYLYYEVVDKDHYYLLAVGQDGKPFTEDDILPKVEVGPSSKVGLLIKKHFKSALKPE